MKETQTNDEKVKKADIWKPKFSQIEIEPDLNIRTDYGDLEELAASIKENGVKVPLRGYRKGYKFVPTDGHRRTAACKLLFEREHLDIEIPFIIETKGTNAEQRIIDMFITNEGKQLNPLEMAEGIRRLINYGWEIKTIADKLGKSDGYIRKLNSLNSAPKKFTNLIIQGVISSTFAIGLIADKGVDDFMIKYEAGDLNQNVQGDDTEEKVEYFVHDEDRITGKTQVNKITKRDVDKINSIKEFKRLSKGLDVEELTDEQTFMFNVIKKMIDNELTGEDLLEIFSSPSKAA